MKHSARGQYGITLRCLTLRCVAKECHCSLLKGGPLSDFSTSGISNTDITLSNTGITVLADVDRTTGYIEYASMITNTYSPVDSGPLKSGLSLDQVIHHYH